MLNPASTPGGDFALTRRKEGGKKLREALECLSLRRERGVSSKAYSSRRPSQIPSLEEWEVKKEKTPPSPPPNVISPRAFVVVDKPFSPPISFSGSHFLPSCLFRREGRRRRRRNGGACDDVGGTGEGGIKAVVRLPVPSQDKIPIPVCTLHHNYSAPIETSQGTSSFRIPFPFTFYLILV